MERDGYCRLRGVARFPPCNGRSEWAHFGEFKRWKTRGLPPTERHRRDRSLMMCAHHHDLYDRHRLCIDAVTDRGTDGPLRYELDGVVYEEAA